MAEARSRPQTDVGLNPAAVVLTIRDLIDDDATVASDVGSHYIYMARHFRVYQPRRLLFSDGQQTLRRRVAVGHRRRDGPPGHSGGVGVGRRWIPVQRTRIGDRDAIRAQFYSYHHARQQL